MNRRFIFYALCLSFLLTACASSNIQLQDGEKSWEERRPSTDKVKHTVYLIGDAGAAKSELSSTPLSKFAKHLKYDRRADTATSIVFLGDNIYPVGMPPLGHEDREEAESRLNKQLKSIKGFGGSVTFIPGNHDWYRYGRAGIQRQEAYLEDFLSQYNRPHTDFFTPSNGCPDIDMFEIAPDLVIVTGDSQWFLTEEEEENDYSDCKFKTRKDMTDAFKLALKDLKGKDVLFTIHHPFYSTGQHGGYFTTSSYISPLTQVNKNLFIPIPVVGVILNKMAPKLNSQDTESQPYMDYRQQFLPAIEEHGKTIVASGHEHNLQLHYVDGVYHIVSGAGSKREEVGKASFTKFAYGNHGYAVLDYYENKEIWISYYGLTEKDEQFKEVYRAQIR